MSHGETGGAEHWALTDDPCSPLANSFFVGDKMNKTFFVCSSAELSSYSNTL